MIGVDFAQLAKGGMPAGELSEVFMRAYFSGARMTYPINPFDILRSMGVAISFRPFGKYEGAYIPADGGDDIPVVGINVCRPIARQRFTAAHELCHHIKDAVDGGLAIACAPGFRSAIERYAESFAAGLLMPKDEMARQIALFEKGGYVPFDGVMGIADYFGVSFQACLHKLAWEFHVIEGDTSPVSLERRRKGFRPNARRTAAGLNDLLLYEQLFDAAGDCLALDMSPRAQQLFKAEYVFHDSRMEGVEIDDETAAAIVADLRIKGGSSEYCSEKNEGIVQVAGLTLVYDYAFGKAKDPSYDISIYDAKRINEKLFSTAPCPEYGGKYRESNTLVFGVKFETVDYGSIPAEMLAIGRELDALLAAKDGMSMSSYIEAVLMIHHRLTVVHAFCDGNGRTSRAFVNLLFTREGIAPVLFRGEGKDLYKAALAKADAAGDLSALFELYFKEILRSYATLSGADYRHQ